jgi:hypothetical protein
MTPRWKPVETPITGHEGSLESVPLMGAVPETAPPPDAESERRRDAVARRREKLAVQGVKTGSY